jgi:hypothetical protein
MDAADGRGTVATGSCGRYGRREPQNREAQNSRNAQPTRAYVLSPTSHASPRILRAIRPGLTPFSTRTLPRRTPRSNAMAAHADLGQDRQGSELLPLRQDVTSSEAQLRKGRTIPHRPA